MTQIIHQQNTLLKQTKQRILQNLNYNYKVIEMPLSEDIISLATDGAFTIREAFTC
jgi:predicted transcriptional regulator YheO